MRMWMTLLALGVGISGCDDDEVDEPVAAEAVAEAVRAEGDEASSDPGEPVDEASEPGERAVVDAERRRPERLGTVAARRAAAAALAPEEKARLRARATKLREGRRLGRAGEHEAALSAFEEALEVAGHDATLLCEAGFQALQLDRADRAMALLEPAIARPAPPRTRAMCLYNLGRTRELVNDPRGAAEAYADSLALRANGAVERRLAAAREAAEALAEAQPAAASPVGFGDEDGGVNLAALEARTFEDPRAMCRAAGCDACWDLAEEDRSVTPPTPTAALRELRHFGCDDEDSRLVHTLLVARSDAGWRFVEAVGESDMGDSYGRLEGTESVEAIQFLGPRVVVLIGGSFDEIDGEAAAYWDCEARHPDDGEALDACFAEAVDPGARPESWTRGYSYVVQEGRLVPDEDPPEYGPLFEALDAEGEER